MVKQNQFEIVRFLVRFTLSCMHFLCFIADWAEVVSFTDLSTQMETFLENIEVLSNECLGNLNKRILHILLCVYTCV